MAKFPKTETERKGLCSELVAGLGVEPSLRDYEPHVQPYTTPHIDNYVYLLRKENYWIIS